jgi:hypothetical protein
VDAVDAAGAVADPFSGGAVLSLTFIQLISAAGNGFAAQRKRPIIDLTL